jgi:hypothetical protein
MVSTSKRSRLRYAPFVLLLPVLACGGGDRYDTAGLASGSSDEEAFLRASQQFFRGSLSAAAEGFGDLAANHADSPLADDALLAARMISRELSGLPDSIEVHAPVNTAVFPPLVLVGQPAASGEMARIARLLAEEGCAAAVIEDQGAPDMTLVLYPEGSQASAQLVADSLSVWLSSPSVVYTQPGGNVIPSVAPGNEGIVVVVGTDAVFEAAESSGALPVGSP